jgi:uncharacterized protein YjdB
MKKKKFVAIAIAVAGFAMSNSELKAESYPTNASGYQIDVIVGNSTTLSVQGDEDGYSTWTSGNHGLLGTNVSITVSEPDIYSKVGKASDGVGTPFYVRLIPSSPSVSVSGNSATISGIHPYFTSPGGNRLFDGATVVGQGQTSYTVTGTGTKTYKLVTTDAFSANGYQLDVVVTFENPPPTVTVTGVTVSPTSKTLSVGETQQLTETVAPSNATNKAVTWSSSNASVASVSPAGLVTANSSGTATITVKTQDGNKTATCVVTITDIPNGNETVEVSNISSYVEGSSLIVKSAVAMTAEIYIYSASGQLVRSVAFHGTEGRVDNLSKGIHIVQILEKGKSRVYKTTVK